MAAVTFGVATWTTTAGAKTGILTPAVGDLLVVICGNSGRTTAQPPTITDNNSSGAYTQVKAATRATSVDSMWAFVRTALIPAASSTTVTFTPTATDTGGGLAVYRVSGMTLLGAAAVKNSGSQDNVASGTPAVPLTTAAATYNPLIGGVLTGTNGSANSAPPSGWAEGNDQGYNTPPTGLATEHVSSGETGSTITFGAVSPSAFCALVIELDTTGLVPPSLVMPTRRAP